MPQRELQLLRAAQLLALVLAVTADGDGTNRITATLSARNIVDADKGGHFNVFFIPAYRLTSNKTLPTSEAQRRPLAPVPAPGHGIDPRLLTARLVGAALDAVVRNATAHQLQRSKVEADDPKRSAQLIRRNPEGEQTLAPQHHDAHILVTVQRPPAPEAAGRSSAVTGSLPLLPVGYGAAHIYNNYPALHGHVPAHYGVANLPHYYFGHLPAPVGGLVAQQSNLVSVSPGTLLGTTGPIYASPGHPAGTLLRPISTPPSPNPTPSTTSAPTPITTDATTALSEKIVTEKSTEAGSKGRRSERLEVARPVANNHNHSEEVEVTGEGGVSVSDAEETTASPLSTQEASPTTATETIDLNKPAAVPAGTPHTEQDQPQPQPLPLPPPNYAGHPLPYPNPSAYPNPGFVFGGYRPGNYDTRYDLPAPPSTGGTTPQQNGNGNDPYRGTNSYVPNPNQQAPVNRSPQPYGNNFPPFFDPGFVPGFAPGYPFGAPPRDAQGPISNYRRPTGPPLRQPGAVYDRFPTGEGVSGGGSSQESSQENASQEDRGGRRVPARYQAAGSLVEDVSPRQQQQQQHYAGYRGAQQYQPLQPTGPGLSTTNPYYRPFPQPTQPFGLHPQYNQFAEEYLSPGRGQSQPTFYTGPLPNQQPPSSSGAASRPSSGTGATGTGDFTPLFNPQQYRPPFGFTGNPFYQPEGDQSEVLERLSSDKPQPRQLQSLSPGAPR